MLGGVGGDGDGEILVADHVEEDAEGGFVFLSAPGGCVASAAVDAIARSEAWFSETDKKAIEDASNGLKEAVKETDIDVIKKKTQDLVQASMKLGEAIYRSEQNAKKPDTSKNDDKKDEGKKDDNVVDADFEEVKEEDKEKSA